MPKPRIRRPLVGGHYRLTRRIFFCVILLLLNSELSVDRHPHSANQRALHKYGYVIRFYPNLNLRYLILA